ncbi:LAMI_0H05292g1_1 [Lachancea mirantina]|uniref:LAMI_0H05292g1_1 n=1 Tax=Lachancea mirantina TaxID=1230905 RepID=A0A1G4KF17_9SACH|nr:LAMI_0H05292g1_1 [Lachancea mirantina]
MSELDKTRTVNDQNTDENTCLKEQTAAQGTAGRAKSVPLTSNSLGHQRRALEEVKTNFSQNEKNANVTELRAVSAVPTGVVLSTNVQSKKRQIYRDSPDEEREEVEIPVAKKPKCDSPDWRDLDIIEARDLCMVSEYSDDIFCHLYEREKQTTPTYNYLFAKGCTEYLRPSLRAILVDWLVEVHLKFQLLPETLYLGINIMDRFMSLKKVSMAKLQLLAVSSLLIAAKFEEVNLPKLSQYAYITDGACSTEDMKNAELYILTTLGFEIGYPSPLNFLRRISKADGYNDEARDVAKFFLEYAICCPKFTEVVPSRLSAMAMYCARRSLDKLPRWDNTHKHYSGSVDALNDSHFRALCRELVEEIAEPSTQLNALEGKYRSERMGSVFEPAKAWCNLMAVRDCVDLFQEPTTAE